MKCWSIYNQIT